MNTYKFYPSLALCVLFALIVSSCKTSTSTSLNTPAIKQATSTSTLYISPTPTMTIPPTPAYYQYKPGSGSMFRFEFTYPSNWKTENRGTVVNGIYSFVIYKDAPPKGVIGGTFVTLDSYQNQAGDLEKTIDEYMQSTENLNGRIIEDKPVSIDGYKARWIARVLPPRAYDDLVANSDVSNVHVSIFLSIDNDMYWFSILIPEKDKDSQFFQDFRIMVMGMKYIP